MTTTPSETIRPIPHPPEKPLIGNALDLDPATQVQDLMEMSREFGEIFYLQLGGRRLVVVSSFALVDELCDEKRFDKRVWAPLRNVRAFAGDGLFTAHTFEPNWQRAHNILLPNFSMAAMKGYHPMMLDIARQLTDRWSRLNAHDPVDVPDDMTRLTLETIGLCGFGYRFDSFYRGRMHPFIRAMTRALSIALGRSVRPDISNRLNFRQNKRFRHAVELMNETVDGIIRERRAANGDGDGDGDQPRDLLGAMLAGRDPETGEGLDDLNIRYQIITFLIAGHETTSGLLSFALHFLTRNQDALERAREEVDRVLGTELNRDPTYQQVNALRYVKQVLNESLRLWPTAPMFALFPKEGETVLGGRYRVDKRDGIAVLVPMLHRDPSVWGEDVERFDPDRFSPEAEAERPPNAFKPFGNGQRACIGRQFAMHEATLALGMILQRFELIPHDQYELEVKETLTIKPDKFTLRLAPRTPSPQQRSRHDARSTSVTDAIDSTAAPAASEALGAPARARQRHGTPLLVLYGSNMGTSEGIAQRIAADGEANGFTVTLAPLDDFVARLPDEGVTVIVTSSYNGTPPDNARQFVGWLEDIEPSDGDVDLSRVRYAVFGCGNRDWAATYQHIPQQIDQLLDQHGAHRVHVRGEGDGAGDFDGDFERWYKGLWPEIVEELDLEISLSTDDGPAARAALYEVEVIEELHRNPFVESFGARPMVVVENRELQSPESGRSTRHIELALTPGSTYRTGDHLGVIARNDECLVRRVAERFGFDENTRVSITKRSHAKSELPTGQPVNVYQLLRDYVELQEVATRSQIKLLLEHAGCPPDRDRLGQLCGDDESAQARFREHVLDAHRTLIDLLEEHPSCELPFGSFLAMLPTLRPRYYSISSSPLKYDRIVSITVAVLEGRARSDRGTFRGVCSSHLANVEKGDVVEAFVRDTASPFRLPSSPQTPLIMVGPGTGIAPFRGFLQERAAQAKSGQTVGPAILFFGCRHPDHDFLYREELRAFTDAGITELVVAFSRHGAEKIYVQHRILEHSEEVWELLEAGGVIYVCGDAAEMAPDVRGAFAEVFRRHSANDDAGDSGSAEAWLRTMADEHRYLVDVWASS